MAQVGRKKNTFSAWLTTGFSVNSIHHVLFLLPYDLSEIGPLSYAGSQGRVRPFLHPPGGHKVISPDPTLRSNLTL